MKQITKVITIMLALLLISPFALPAQAQGGNNWPNPNFMASATPAGKTSMPYYDLEAMIDIYLSDGLSYYVDEDTQAVVQIFTPDEYPHETTTSYSEDQLRKMAETIAYMFIKDDTRLENLSFSLGQKIDNYFFHWDDTSKQLYDGTHPFIQIGISQDGDFLNLVNTLPFSKAAGSFDISQTINSAPATTFYNGVYANGGSYWSQYGTFSSATGGWFNAHPTGCSGTFCSKYYYTTARTNPLYWGKWTPNSTTNTRATFFIPSNNATAFVRYEIVDYDNTMITVDIDQNEYFNVFLLSDEVSMSAIRRGIWYIRLWDMDIHGRSGKKVAWDEVRVYTQSFDDVPEDHWAYWDVERLFSNGITAGCGSGNYCPNTTLTRAEMAVFLLVSEHGAGYNPPPATGTVFNDVPANAFAAAFIEQLAAESITAGCGGGNYCPNSVITHAEMAVFLLRARYGSTYVPPAATGYMFGDVPANHWAAKWIEDAANKGFSYGQHECAPGNFCPAAQVTRAEMAIMLVPTFNLP
jgi:hypothetical protein